MLKKNLFLSIPAFVISLLFLHCAGQGLPGGGPIDTTPPAIVRTQPDTNAVHIQTNTIELEFSEYVEHRSAEESIFISPYIGDLEFDWSGTTLTVEFSESLRKNTTYVVNVGTDIVDQRAKNRMAAGYTLAFSTGDSIDKGFISGQVFDEKPEGVMIFAYELTNVDPDTLDPTKVKPDYIMQTGKGGAFTLANIAFGKYRLFAVRDEFRNLIYNKQVDQYGVTTGDVIVRDQRPKVRDVWFKLSREDTTKPFLTSVQSIQRRELRLHFSESIDSLSFGKAVFHLSDTLGLTPVNVTLAFLYRSTPTQAGLITSADLDSGKTYLLRVERLFDISGNPIDTLHASYIFAANGDPDTVKPAFVVQSLRDSTRNYPLNQPIMIQFSEPVFEQPLTQSIALYDSSMKHVETQLHWFNPTELELVPKTEFNSKAWYQLRVQMDSLMDLQRNGFKDSTYVLHFESLDLRSTGVVEGTITDDRGDSGKGAIYVSAISIDLKPRQEKTIRLEKPAKYRIDRLVEGRYVLQAFRDADSSGSYSYGLPFPFVPSERFAAYPDTLRVRARWNVENAILRFK